MTLTKSEQEAFERWLWEPRDPPQILSEPALLRACAAWGIAYGREQERKRAAEVARSFSFFDKYAAERIAAEIAKGEG